MRHVFRVGNGQGPAVTLRAASASTLRFDLVLVIFLSLAIGGLFSDLWAHSHGLVETFFTPWHAALYSATGAVFVVLAVGWARDVRAGLPARSALPDGYGPSFFGAILFLVGGFLDMLWHVAFGIEANLSALFSPTHILLFASGLLMTSGPLLAAWRRRDGAVTPWPQRMPMVISLALVLSVLSAMTQFIDPVVGTFAERTAAATSTFSELYTMHSDGLRQTRVLARENAHYSAPVWSPDGSRIAVATRDEHASGIAVISADGSAVRTIFETTAASSPGSWLPDGSRLAIVVREGELASHIELVDPNGGGRTRLTHGAWSDGHPAFSPDGARIAFYSNRAGRVQVYVMNADGGGVTQLTHGDDHSWAAAWSPDGDRLAFNSDRTGRLEIYVMNADGSDQRQLTSVTHGSNSEPAWSPDGRRIAFVSTRDDRRQIYVMNSDGSGQTNLSRTPGLDALSPSWSRDGVIAYAARSRLPYLLEPDVRERLGLAGVLVQSALLSGLVLLAIPHGGLPFGALTIVFGLNTGLMSLISDEYRLIPGAVIAGLASDVLLWRLRPGRARPLQLRIVAFLVPASYYTAYLFTLLLGRGISWPVHLWTGSVVLAGSVGILLSFVLEDTTSPPSPVQAVN